MRFTNKNMSLLAIPLLGASLAFAQNGVTLHIDAAAHNHPIDPNIYGMANYGVDPAFAKEIKLPNARWGGDGTTRYNWQVDSSNSGADFYFLGGSGSPTSTPSGQVDQMINTYKPAGTNPLITIPIIPYINSTSNFTCSYLESVYGAQQAYNPYVSINGDQCGNGLAVNGDQLVDTNIYYNNIDNTPSLQQAWVSHLVDTFGKGSKGGIHYFQLDNEPMGWGNTHRDVEPNGALYETIVDLGEQYASAIKDVYPQAKIMGPSDFTLGGWIGDTSQQDNLLAGQYYLSEFAKYDKENGKRTLDYFDEHFYGPGGSNASELQSTRVLWDPTYNSGTWVELYVFNGPMQLIPRFRQWTKDYYPGTPVAISEYSMTNGGTTIYDALTQADTLGIFAREDLAFADLWTVPAPQDPVAFSYRLFRNFDGKGGQFGDIWTRSWSADQTQLAIYGSKSSSDKSLTIIVINKTDQPITSPINISNFETKADYAKVFQYTSANLTQIVQQPSAPLAKLGNTVHHVSLTFPALSASVVVLPYKK